MGKKLQKQAMQLGLTNLPKYTFFGRPKKLKMKFSKYKPDLAYTVENWMKNLDPSTAAEESGGGRNNTFFYLASQIGMYVEIADKMAGVAVPNPGNHASKIDIYTNNEDYVRTIVRIINTIWDDGILNHLDFQKLEKKYKVRREDIINAWNAFL
ncbi:MAG: hypothetical protein HWN81_03425 [Candidatus Lokiarchaeota archaeon]|nr:hypothetical protein [Candidatus Lokiarchaeota archaeon]